MKTVKIILLFHFLIFSYLAGEQIIKCELNDESQIRIYLRKLDDKRGFDNSCVNLITVSQNFFDGTVIPGYLGSEKTVVDLFKDKVIEALSNGGFTVIYGDTNDSEKSVFDLEVNLYRVWMTWKGGGKWDTELKFGYLIFDAEKDSLVKDEYINYNEIIVANKELKTNERVWDVLNRGMDDVLKAFVGNLEDIKKGGN